MVKCISHISLFLLLIIAFPKTAKCQRIVSGEVEEFVLNDINKKYNCGLERCLIRKKQTNYDSVLISSFLYDSIFTLREKKFRIDSNIYFYKEMPFDTSFIKNNQFYLSDDDTIIKGHYNRGNNTIKLSNLLLLNENLYVNASIHSSNHSSYRYQWIFYKFKKDKVTLKWVFDSEAIISGCN